MRRFDPDIFPPDTFRNESDRITSNEYAALRMTELPCLRLSNCPRAAPYGNVNLGMRGRGISAKGASIYDVRSGWGSGAPKSRQKEQIQLICDYDKGGGGQKIKKNCERKKLFSNCSILLQAMTKMAFVSNSEEEASKCLKEMDLDGDGRVSYAEFMVKWRIT